MTPAGGRKPAKSIMLHLEAIGKEAFKNSGLRTILIYIGSDSRASKIACSFSTSKASISIFAAWEKMELIPGDAP